MSINQLEQKEAELGKNTFRKYYDGTTECLRKTTRGKVARALKVKPQQLPD